MERERGGYILQLRKSIEFQIENSLRMGRQVVLPNNPPQGKHRPLEPYQSGSAPRATCFAGDRGERHGPPCNALPSPLLIRKSFSEVG